MAALVITNLVWEDFSYCLKTSRPKEASVHTRRVGNVVVIEQLNY